MLKINHIKFKPINIVLLFVFSLIFACYMPRGGLIVNNEKQITSINDTVYIVLPADFQIYKFFKVTQLENNQLIEANKMNDSTILILSKNYINKAGFKPLRVEAGIIPFY